MCESLLLPGNWFVFGRGEGSSAQVQWDVGQIIYSAWPPPSPRLLIQCLTLKLFFSTFLTGSGGPFGHSTGTFMLRRDFNRVLAAGAKQILFLLLNSLDKI